MSLTLTAARGVTQVVDRCEAAKESGFLDLSQCNLMFIADAVYLLLKGYNIDKVSIQQNAMKKFPKKFVLKFPEATIFNMEGNAITEIPEEIGSWTSLKGVNAASNGIETFPEAFYKLEKLIYINLKGNKIKDLDVDRLFTSLLSLVQLDLSENPIPDDLKTSLQSKKPEKLNLIF